MALAASGAGVAAMALVTGPARRRRGGQRAGVRAARPAAPCTRRGRRRAARRRRPGRPDPGRREATGRPRDPPARRSGTPTGPCQPRDGSRISGSTRSGSTWDGRAGLSDASLDLAPGDRVGVVGPSGSGKSTLAALLLRFIDPTSGRLTMAGVDLRDLALDDVRARVGLVDDDPHVFASTARGERAARPPRGDGRRGRAGRARSRAGDLARRSPRRSRDLARRRSRPGVGRGARPDRDRPFPARGPARPGAG